MRPDAPRDCRDPRQPDQVADRNLPRPRQVSRATHRVTVRPSPTPMCMESSPLSTPERPAPAGSITVEISDTQAHVRVDAEELARLVRRVLEGEGRSSAVISVALVDNAAVARINREHLDHEGPTDVISFVLSDPGDPELAGELV